MMDFSFGELPMTLSKPPESSNRNPSEEIILQVDPLFTFPTTIFATSSFGIKQLPFPVILLDQFGNLIRFQFAQTEDNITWNARFPDIDHPGWYVVEAFTKDGQIASKAIQITSSPQDPSPHRKAGLPEIQIKMFTPKVCPANQSPANITVRGTVDGQTFVAVVLKRAGGDLYEGIAFGVFDIPPSPAPTLFNWTAMFEEVPTGSYYLTAYESGGSSDTSTDFTIPSSVCTE
jgi:hypothetical protein